VVKEVIEKLVDSNGVGFPMASTILKFINPSVFPVIDVRAYRALTGRKLYYASYSYEIYVAYAKSLVRECGVAHGRCLSSVAGGAAGAGIHCAHVLNCHRVSRMPANATTRM
jgi:hypothetical protein